MATAKDPPPEAPFTEAQESRLVELMKEATGGGPPADPPKDTKTVSDAEFAAMSDREQTRHMRDTVDQRLSEIQTAADLLALKKDAGNPAPKTEDTPVKQNWWNRLIWGDAKT